MDTENGAALTGGRLKPYQLIAGGSSLDWDGIDINRYPIGYSDATMIDQKYDGNKAASLIILGVGREGGAPCSEEVPLLGLKFPYVFSLETEDLLFPYTQNAWEESGNSKDTIAVTAFISPSGVLATPDPAVKWASA